MKVISEPGMAQWPELCTRPQLNLAHLDGRVREILAQVRTGGDEALRQLTLTLDKSAVQALRVSREEILQAAAVIPLALKEAIGTAIDNIEKFHRRQSREVLSVETMPGVRCWRKGVPIEKVGIYIPGGSAPLFSTVLMLGIPARLAGCRQVVLCTPPGPGGAINPAILYAADQVGIQEIFKVGGAQAIAAMAYGTETVPAVYKIFGPGNQYVTKAKQLVSQEAVAIDMPAGPSEVLVVADETAVPAFVAADLLSQAEHGADSQVMLVVTPAVNLTDILQELESQLAQLPRKDIARQALDNSVAVSFQSPDDIIRFTNAYAPEHLIINTANAEELAEKITNAGSVFLGNYTPEAAGDYASGTNHTLPTNGYARASAGVSLESFIKYITFQQITPQGLQGVGPAVEAMAAAESLTAHQRAVTIRLNQLKTSS